MRLWQRWVGIESRVSVAFGLAVQTSRRGASKLHTKSAQPPSSKILIAHAHLKQVQVQARPVCLSVYHSSQRRLDVLPLTTAHSTPRQASATQLDWTDTRLHSIICLCSLNHACMNKYIARSVIIDSKLPLGKHRSTPVPKTDFFAPCRSYRRRRHVLSSGLSIKQTPQLASTRLLCSPGFNLVRAGPRCEPPLPQATECTLHVAPGGPSRPFHASGLYSRLSIRVSLRAGGPFTSNIGPASLHRSTARHCPLGSALALHILRAAGKLPPLSSGYRCPKVQQAGREASGGAVYRISTRAQLFCLAIAQRRSDSNILLDITDVTRRYS